MGENIYRIFDGVWNLSLVGGYCVLLVLLARLLLQKAPKWCSYLLWGIVFVRLCCPILPETGISLIPDKLLSVGTEMTSGQQTVGPGSHGYAEANDTKDIGDVLRREYDAEEVPDSQAAEKTMAGGNDNTVMNTDGTQDFSLGTARTESGATVAGVAASGTDAVISGTSAGTGTDARAWTYPVWFRVLSMVWLAGMLGFLGYHAYSYLRMRHRIRRLDSGVRQVEPGICEIDGGHLSFVMGLIHPVIYLSSGLDPESRKVVLCHERVHLQRRDYLWKPLALVICCVHWFNPLVWVAYILFCRDIELACDEKVVRGLDGAARADYSQALLSCAAPKRAVAACPLAFGEGNIKTRVKSALHYKKPAFWVAAAAVLAVVIVAVCFLTNPRSERGSLVWAQKLNAADVASIELYVPAEGEARQYKKLDTEEMAQAVELINSSRGTYIEKPETVYAGLPVWFLLTMDDGTVHAVGSVVGHYLIIDGDTFDADVENQAEWENYVLKGDSASPIDMADRLSYALYGMTTGVYTLGEAVFEDSVWETSYEETFANTKSTPELWLSSALGTDMTGILYGTVTAARGYSYRFSEWEEIDLTVSNFDWLFRSASGEDWNGTSAAKLRRENAHAWRGTKTADDDNATATIPEIARQDELAAMDQWLLLQQKDGSLYLVMGYRSGGLPYSGAHPYRWIVRLNGGATELTRADLNGDGIEEVISYTGTSTQEPYRLRVSNQSGEELWSAELGLAHVGWSSYFLYRDSVKTALLCYEPTMYQGEASYSYRLFLLSGSETTTLAENSVSFSINLDSKDPWPAEAQKFADEVNRLLDKSELLFSTLNGELHSYGDGTVIRCAEPSESDGSRALASADLDNDGRAEQIICEKAFGGYELCVVDNNGEELMRDRMWEGDVYFLCRENGRDMLLQYSLFEGKNQDAISYCDYYYGLHTFDGGKLNIVENNNTSIYLNWDGTQNGDWGESQQAFAARVNELIDQSEFLIAQQDGELILTSEVQRWYCVSPKTIRVAMDDTTIYIDRKSWDFAEQYPSLKGFEDIGTAGNYFVAFGRLGEKNDLYVVFNFVAGTLLKTFPGNNLIWQGDDLSTAVYSYRSDVYALNGTKLAALELASGEEISGLAFSPDGVSIIATVSGKSGERKVTVTREGSA